MLKKEEFEKNKTLVAEYGSYENYANANKYTFDDAVSVANTGSLPTTPQQTPTDDLTAQYTDAYNQMVEKNNAVARNRAVASRSEYNEMIRNANEVNKAQGTANTGYAGDTSIDAYNAYRNSVMAAYNEANSSNNELYRYYLENMANERAYQDDKETKVTQELQYIINDNGTYDDGYLTKDAKTKINDYLVTTYGSVENVPSGIKAYLGTLNGYYDNETDYETNHNYEYKIYDKAVLKGGAEAKTIDGGDDFFKIGIEDSNGDLIKYRLTTVEQKDETGKVIGDGSVTDANILRLMPKETGSFMRYNGKYYVRDIHGKIYEAKKNNGTVLKVEE